VSLLKETSLENIAEGVAKELFAHELAKVARNIGDVNTNATVKRKITLSFEFTPDDNRDESKIHVSCVSKLAPTKGFTRTVFVGKQNGVPTFFGQDTKQLELDTVSAGVSKITGEVKNA
jgi:hypothetical protein